MQTIDFYADEDKVAGISFYSYQFTEALSQGGHYPFYHIDDQADTYFMKVPSSLGLSLISNMWKNFKNWYKNHLEITSEFYISSYFILFIYNFIYNII